MLRVTAGQLDALQQDEAVDHLSGDIRYRHRRRRDVVAQTIGADQVWAGTERRPARLTGSGIAVAVIDSGIDPSTRRSRGA